METREDAAAFSDLGAAVRSSWPVQREDVCPVRPSQITQPFVPRQETRFLEKGNGRSRSKPARKSLQEDQPFLLGDPRWCLSSFLTWRLCVFSALLSVTTVNYLLSVVSLVLFYLYYTHSDGCTENKVFISINMLLCVAASLLSILPQIQVQTTLPFLPHTFGTQTLVLRPQPACF